MTQTVAPSPITLDDLVDNFGGGICPSDWTIYSLYRGKFGDCFVELAGPREQGIGGVIPLVAAHGSSLDEAFKNAVKRISIDNPLLNRTGAIIEIENEDSKALRQSLIEKEEAGIGAS